MSARASGLPHETVFLCFQTRPWTASASPRNERAGCKRTTWRESRVDFRGLDGERYFAKVKELGEVLRGKPKGPPADLGRELQPPPGSGVRAAGPVRWLLVVSSFAPPTQVLTTYPWPV